ncbi:MAG: type II toxin-antitoxin system PemK/MazF family toxin [Thermoplasmatota archaeon]
MARYHDPFRAGDVVWGPDAYHADDPYLEKAHRRPWLIISSDKFPGSGDQYLCCALTTGVTTGPGFIELNPAADWEEGGTPKPSQVDTETIMTMKHRWIVDYSGRLTFAKLARARRAIKGYL